MDSYTFQIENRMWDMDYDTDDYSHVIDFLNTEESFRSFGDGLVAFMQKKDPSMNPEKAMAHLVACCEYNGVDEHDIGSLNTLKSWFRGGPRPKKGEDSRKTMFAIAFALRLTADETAELFHKVYLDRAFNFRNEKELVYYFCLSNNKTWSEAQRILAAIEHTELSEDATVFTTAIRHEIDSFTDENQLLAYIQTHRHNMEQNNISASKNLEKLLVEAKKYARLEAALPANEGQYGGQWKNEDTVSVNFMYSVITETTPSAKKGTTTVFKNARLPKEIKSRFPEAGSFSEKNPTYESIRKMIMLLFSYVFWYHIQWDKLEADIEDYTEQLNALLNECGFSELYYGNPYDWFFLYCTVSENPLDVFRSIVAEVLAEETD